MKGLEKDDARMVDRDSQERCGYVAIVGRPNVGKSTLLNHLLGLKLSITSRKPQTTRHNVLGIKTNDDCQLIFVDTPGIHSGQDKAINRYMNKAAETAIRDVDVIIFVVDRLLWSEADQAVAEKLSTSSVPLIIAINKVDRLENNAELLPHIEYLQGVMPDAEIIPVSALQKKKPRCVGKSNHPAYSPKRFSLSRRANYRPL